MPAQTADPNLRFLDNGKIRLGIDLSRGGSITYLSRSGTDSNVVNSFDLGRQIQMSHYGGPVPFTPGGKQPQPVWRGLGWNPIQTGDCFGHPSRVLSCDTRHGKLNVRCQPMQWPLDNVPGDCLFATEISLDNNTARVRCRLENHRDDRTPYPARDQELPAVYTNGPYHHLMAYTGDRPFTGDKLTEIANAGPPWAGFTATENWAALVDDSGFGLGIRHEGIVRFIGGFAGKRGTGGPKDGPTGYIAPLQVEILDPEIVYEYEYMLILGTLDDIRHIATKGAKATPPDYRFDQDRAHWHLSGDGALDTGWPIHGSWNIKLTGGAGKPPQLIGPESFWYASDAPHLYIDAAFPDGFDGQITAYWSRRDAPGFAPTRSISLPIRGEGKRRTYTLDLSTSPEYRGIITNLRLDPTGSTARPGDTFQLSRIRLTK